MSGGQKIIEGKIDELVRINVDHVLRTNGEIADDDVAEALTIFGERERYSRSEAMRAVLKWALERFMGKRP